MSKRTLLIGILLAVLTVSLSGVFVTAGGMGSEDDSAAAKSLIITREMVEPYLVNGEADVPLPDGSTLKVNDFGGMTMAEILEIIKMSPEAEAKIIHQVPSCPVIIDGVKYEPEQIHLFDGQQLGFITGKDGSLYAFTTEEGLRKFKEAEGLTKDFLSPKIAGSMSYFYKDWWYGGEMIGLNYTVSLPSLPSDWNDVISSLQISDMGIACRIYEDAYYSGDYYEASAGATNPLLWMSGFNDTTSSILHIY